MSGLHDKPHDRRMETLATGIPVAAKLWLLLGAAGGLFLAVVCSFAAPAWQYHGLGLGLVAGILGASVLTVWKRQANSSEN